MIFSLAILVVLLPAASAAAVEAPPISSRQTALAQWGALQPSMHRRRELTSSTTVAPASPSVGGTACQCICGDRVVWHRAVFPGNVKKEKELECENEVCPNILIPGLKVYAECVYVEDMEKLTAGSLCHCQCGEQTVWHNRAFYGDVVKEKEEYCLKELCPQVNPIPGLRYEAKCVYHPELFKEKEPEPTSPPGLPPWQKGAAAGRHTVLFASACVAAGVLILMP